MGLDKLAKIKDIMRFGSTNHKELKQTTFVLLLVDLITGIAKLETSCIFIYSVQSTIYFAVFVYIYCILVTSKITIHQRHKHFQRLKKKEHSLRTKVMNVPS